MISKLFSKSGADAWRKLAARAAALPADELRNAAAEATETRHFLNEVLAEAEARLGLPRIGAEGLQMPRNADWTWRPDLWRVPFPQVGLVAAETRTPLGGEVTLFHDCQLSEMTLRQIRNRREDDLAPFGLRLDVFSFDGSFLSLVVDLPPEAASQITKRHLLRLNTVVEMEQPIEIFARLNLRHGPNTEQIVRELPLAQEDVWVEFDLGYTKINEKRIERMWIDLIFEGPEMNQVILRDVTLSRAPRAEL